ncbi:MAG: adenosylmethionine decarboxylase [Nocardioides sp.]
MPTEAQTAASTEMCSYAVDLWTHDVALLTDEARLLEILRAAAEAGSAVVLAEASHVFDNGAVTIALVLSQSHLNIHTWPEFNLANIDLLTCGILEGDVIVEHLKQALSATRINVSRVSRDAVPDVR